MEWQAPQTSENGYIRIPDRWLHLYYYEALNILFRFENAMRVFVYAVLKQQLGDAWDNAALDAGSCIKSETKKRIHHASEHGYLGYEVASPMLYLTSGELTQIILSDAYWKYFAKHFKASKEIIKTKLQEIGTVRNSLAHFRPIKPDDIDLIKQNSKHILLEIEKYIVQLTSISTPVPTNLEEDWYKKIKSVGADHLTTNLFLSKNDGWIRIELRYSIPTLAHNAYGNAYADFTVANLRTSKLLEKYPLIRNSCIYVSESYPYGSLNENWKIDSTKSISLVIPKDTLIKNLSDIEANIREIALTCDSETEQLAQDHLARGSLIEAITLSAFFREGEKHWTVNIENLKTKPEEINCVEFWGQRLHFETDFISATDNYPWMPSSVSANLFGF